MPKKFNSQGGALPILILLAAVGLLGFLLISNTFEFRDTLFNRLFPKPQSEAAAIRGQSGDLWADIVIGQPDFGMITPFEVVAYKLHLGFGGGVIVDRSISPGRLYVYDGGNSRILGIDLAKCYSQNSPCSADIVIGQPSTDRSACNGDGNFQNALPGMTEAQLASARAPASASTLCGIVENQISITENISMANMFVDGQGNLYVPDHKNNRVLKYNSPFTTDTVADEVWGQQDFTGILCNQDAHLDPYFIRQPTAQTLCFNYAGGGVGADSSGNVWVADSANHRVLRYSVGSKTADLVLGQSDLNSGFHGGAGSAMNKMSNPNGLRFDSQGNLYVVDAGNKRVLVFNPPFVTGMSATRTLGSNLCPEGIEIDPGGAGVWIQDDCDGHSRLLLLDFNGTVLKVLGKDTTSNNQECGGAICNNAGSLGIDATGNILVSSGRYVNDVLRYSPPFPDPSPGYFHPVSKKLFSPPDGANLQGAKGLGSSVQMTLAAQQLIATDRRILFWNDPTNLSTGKAADGVVIPAPDDWPHPASFTGNSPWGFGNPASDGQRFWITLFPPVSEIWAYQLPLVTNAKAVAKLKFPIPVLGGGQISASAIGGIDLQEGGKYLWVTFHGEGDNNHRVIRIKDPLTNPLVDVILGQGNATDTGCNRDPNAKPYNDPKLYPVTANSICFPSVVKVDRLGNVWVSDYSLETKGNFRLLEFNASLFQNITNQALFGPDASKIFPNLQVISIAFDSTNRMVLGYGYGSGQFYGVYDSPLGSGTTPDRYLNDYYSIGASAEFDIVNNLYTADLNRSRILIYKSPLNGLVPTPSPIPSTPTPTPTPSPTPTPTPGAGGDSIAPEVSITSPQDGEVIQRNSRITISANATDNIGVSKLEFYVGGRLITTDTTSPYSYSYKLPGKPNTTYTITAAAYDAAGNSSSDSITILSR